MALNDKPKLGTRRAKPLSDSARSAPTARPAPAATGAAITIPAPVERTSSTPSTSSTARPRPPAARPAAAALAPAGAATSSPTRRDLERFGPHAAIGIFVSLALVFVGERVFATSDTARLAITALGLTGFAASVALRVALAARADGERRSVEVALARYAALPALGLVGYFATTETGRKLTGIAALGLEPRTKVLGVLTVAWVGLVVIGLLPLAFGEASLAPMRAAARIELRRVTAATRAGLALAFAVLYVGLTTFGASFLDVRADFSYFRTARPGDSTQAIAKKLESPLKIQAFFPPLNEVGIEVGGYLDDLARASSQVQVEKLDRLAVPGVAKDAKVTSDGVLVLSREGMRETLFLGTEMKTAAAKLKTLDGDFQKALLKVLRTARTAYFTTGHGELNEPNASPATELEGKSAKTFKKVLENQNYAVKDLGLAQGLGKDVPDNAFLVVVLGPTRPFLPEEVAALERFAARGGKLFVALDPEAKVDLAPIARAVDLVWQPKLLANDKMHMSRRQPRPNDTTILLSNRFSSHASVSTLSRNSARMALIVPGASSLEKLEGTTSKTDFVVRAQADSFLDDNANFTFDEGAEKRSSYNIAAAVSRPAPGQKPSAKPDAKKPGADNEKPGDENEMRALVVADVDSLSDAALGYEANFLFAVDGLRWLGGDESFSGSITTTEDVRIEHTKAKDQLWFYGIIFGAPTLVLAAGLLVSRRARRGDTQGRPRGDAAQPNPAVEAAAADSAPVASRDDDDDDDEADDDDDDEADDDDGAQPKGKRS